MLPAVLQKFIVCDENNSLPLAYSKMLFSVERDSSQNLVPLGCHGFDVGDISVVCEVESMAEHRVEDARGTFKTQSRVKTVWTLDRHMRRESLRPPCHL